MLRGRGCAAAATAASSSSYSWYPPPNTQKRFPYSQIFSKNFKIHPKIRKESQKNPPNFPQTNPLSKATSCPGSPSSLCLHPTSIDFPQSPSHHIRYMLASANETKYKHIFLLINVTAQHNIEIQNIPAQCLKPLSSHLH